MEKKKALVIFSGGQDSTTCLAWAKHRYEEVTAVSFFYGQQHRIELEQAGYISRRLGIPWQTIDVSFYGSMVRSALTGEGDLCESHADHPELPASFVPNRNALFILLAHSLAQSLECDTLVTGVCQTDFSGYPDCRRDFIEAIQHALNLGASTSIRIETPLMDLSKADTFKLAEDEGVLDLVLKASHSCYKGSSIMNEWGRGCGSCPACQLRAKGYRAYKTQYGET